MRNLTTLVSPTDRGKAKRFAFAGLLIIALSGCLYQQVGNRFDADTVAQLTPGISTTQDAISLLGSPAATSHPGNGNTLLQWQYAYGTPVGGGAAHAAILFGPDGKMIRVAHLFGGSAPSAQATLIAQNPGITQLNEIKAQMKSCISKVRQKPIYAPLQPHLRNLDTEQFTTAQITDNTVPTDAESQLMVAYNDELTPCVNRYIGALVQVAPAAQTRSDTEAVQLLLIKRKLTWGEATQRLRQIDDSAQAKLRAARV